MSSRTRQRLAAALGLGLAATSLQLLATPTATANPAGTQLVISEVYGAGGFAASGDLPVSSYTHDYIELYNPTDSAVDLSTWAVFYGSATRASGANVSNKTNLTGSIPAHGHYLVQGSGNAANGTPLPTPDVTGSLSLSSTSGLVILSNQQTTLTPATGSITNATGVIDAVGYGTANTFEGANQGTTLSGTTAATRAATGADTDANNTDFTVATPDPENTSDVDAPPADTPLEATAPGNKTGTVGQAVAGFTLAATGGTEPYSWSATGLPPGVSVAANGAVSGTPTTEGSYDVTATVTDDASIPATDDVTFTYTISPALTVRTIAELQGTSVATSPYAGTTQTTEGVVTAMYPSGGFSGMYIQTPGADTPDASDAIFVYGANSMPAGVAIGDSVQVTGPVSEFSGTTEITPASGGVTEIATLGTAVAREIAYPTTEAGREAHEGELLAPTDEFVVSNSYGTNQYAEIGLATGGSPLVQPTEVKEAGDAAGLAEIKADNAKRAVTLDDASTINFLSNANKGIALPWLSKTNPIRVGASADFLQPVILEYRNSIWKFQPTQQVTGTGTDVVAFENTRVENETPQSLPGDLKLATFNVLNYFNTTGEQYVANGVANGVNTACTYYNDRDGNPIANNTCGVVTNGTNAGNGPRGAANTANFLRQQSKIVTAINRLGADVVALEEIENSIKLTGEGNNRDDALSALVKALNAQAGAGTWKFVTSPSESVQSGAVSLQDVIRSAFIYKAATVSPVGASDLYLDESANASGSTPAGAFANAREPLAQAFKPKGTLDSNAFAVIANHFKSKGDSTPPATGDNANGEQGAFNGDRVRQATKLLQFANSFADARGIEAVFLAGDFNSYSQEDPMQVLYDGGFAPIESPGEETYSFSGLSGSLDHVLGNPAAMAMVTGADIWDINASESVAFQYSRYNYNLTDFFQGDEPFAASDHNPEIVGIDVPDAGTDYSSIQLLATNDFHGRLLADGANAAGAAVLAGAVDELRAENPNTVFAAAGDLIGASTFESFIQKDEPTIEALNEAGLEVSAAGNHEFDAGYEDLVGRVQDLADWEYIAANVVEPEGRDDLAETWTKTFTTDAGEIKVGFVGAVTEDLPSLVSPSGIQGVTVTDIVDATNAAATDLKADGADLVVLLVHEGAQAATYASATDENTAFGHIVNHVSDDVDAIVSGHTHLAYNFAVPVAGWSGRAVTKRPVVSAGQYGTNLNQLLFTYDNSTDQLAAISQDVIGLAGAGFEPNAEVAQTVADAKAQADVLGAQVLGQIEGPFNRAKLADGSTENRGGESTLGNLVAEVQRWATENPESGSAQIAFMNPGGLRADMAGTVNGDARDLTYKQAAVVQPFANTLVNMDLTGAQIEKVLEQQWQRDASGNVPSRAFLRLGISDGFTYTYYQYDDPAKAGQKLGEVTGMWLDGTAIDPAATYSVTVNSFLASGGDNFFELNNGTGKADTGKVDLQAMVDYLADATPVAVDYSQRSVGVTFPADAPASYGPGDTVAFNVSSWAMSTTADVKDTEIQVKIGDQVVDTATLDNTIGSAATDEYGTAAVSFELPANVEDGPLQLTLVGAQSASSVPVGITADDGVEDIQILATNDFHGRIQNDAASAAAGAAVLSGAVKQLRAANPNTVFAAAGDLIGASTFESFIQNDKPTIDALNEAGLEVSAVGNHELDQGYDDLTDRVMAEYDAEDNPEGGAEWQYIAANLKIKATGDPAVPATWVKTMDGVDVGFVGAVTEDLPSLVSPSGIAELQVDPIVSSVNAATEDLKDAGADIVVMLVHEGAPSTNCATMNTGDGAWAKIVNGVNDDVDAIVSGHTHLEYNCSFPVAGWAGRAVTERPVVSAGQYGANLNQLVFSVDAATGDVVAKTQAILKLKSCANATSCTNYPADQATADIVSAAVAKAEVLGAQKLGELNSAFNRAKLSNGTTENRGGESTLGNLVAEVQRWATETPEAGAAQIAFMNPGGLRADMTGTGTGTFPRDLTYKQAAVVQPFANTLVNMDLTGAQIETVLEQQWQRDTNNKLPTRPFLRLGISDGFTYTYSVKTVTETPTNGDPAYQAPKGEITGMWLDGAPIDPEATYSVTVNSFLASGGDNFRELANGAGKQDTGKVDLQAMVDYMAAAEGPVSADYTQRSVGVTFPADAPASYAPGDTVAFAASSLAFSTAADAKDPNVTVFLGETPLRTTPVDNTIGDAVYDEYGTAPVTFVVPAGTPAGPTEFRLVGNQTGTEVPVTVDVAQSSGLTAADDTVVWGEAGSIAVTVTGNNGTPTGMVAVFEGATKLGEATLAGGAAAVSIAAKSLEPGVHELTVEYSGDSTYDEMSDEATLTVTKATTSVAADDVTLTWGDAGTVEVTVDETATGTVEVLDGETVLGSAEVTNGVATVSLAAKSLEPGVHALTASYEGDSHFEGDTASFDVTVAKDTTTIDVDNVSFVYGRSGSVRVTLDPTATGTVALKAGSRVLDTATLSGGQATLVIPAESIGTGRTTLTVTYGGDAHFDPASASLTATVAKAKSTTTAKAKPSKVVVKKTKATITVDVDGANGVKATGKVKITVAGQGTKTVTLKNGKASLTLKAFSSTGSKAVKVEYLGSDELSGSSDKLTIKVVKK